MSRVSDEQRKFIASGLNSAAGAIFAGGVVAPVVTLMFGFGRPSVGDEYVVAGSVVCFMIAFILHCVGLAILGGLNNDAP